MRLRIAFILLVAAAFKPAVRPEQRSAILISWDGAGGEHVRAAVAAGKLPNLARLGGQGALVDIEVTGHGTDTKPGHAQMLTGYDPNVTGVYSNGKFRPIPRGYSIFERLHQAFGKNGLATIMLTGKGPNLGSQSPEGGNAEPFSLARPSITVWDGDQIRPARLIGDRALRYIHRYADKGRFFFFIHFPDVDVAGHTHGEGSSEYDLALGEVDAWLGKITAALEAEGATDRTLVYVSADHGFDKGAKRHTAATHIFLATNDPAVSRAGEQRDIAPTVLSAMGVDPTTITPRLPGKILAK
jgi:predicted AlkP superfamily pyrophosphatase or phosphodiesterase